MEARKVRTGQQRTDFAMVKTFDHVRPILP